MRPDAAGSGPGSVLVPVLAGLLLAGSVALFLAVADPPRTVVDVCLGVVTGVVATVGGVRLLWHGPARRPALAGLLGAALVLWGAGRLAEVGWGLAGFGGVMTPGDLLSLGAAALVLAGVLSAPRRVDPLTSPTTSPPWVGVVLDAGLLSATSGLLLWRLVFLAPVVAGVGGGREIHAPVVALVLLVEVFVCAAVVVVAVRDCEPHLGGLAAAVTACGVGEVATLAAGVTAATGTARASGPGEAGTWVQLVWLACWPLAVWGARRYRPPRGLDDPSPLDVDPDARVTVLVTTSSLLLLGAGVVAIVLQGGRTPMDGVSWALTLTAIALLWVRELLSARTRTRLLGRLHDDATTDPLTGVGNRRALTARVADLAPDEDWCLLALDIDGFKRVNDLFGHSVADQLLAAVAGRLSRSAPRSAAVCRIGGDEFAVLIPGGLETGRHQGRVLLDAVSDAGRRVGGLRGLHVTASGGLTVVQGSPPAAGLTVLPAADVPAEHSGLRAALPGGQPTGQAGGQPGGQPTASDPLSALAAAAAALQTAKAGGQDQLEVFDGVAAHRRARRLRLEERLRLAIAEGALDVRYQPVVDLRTGQVTGVEALARWTDPLLGAIRPAEFVPLAEQTGLVGPLGELVLRRALAHAAEHRLPDRGLRVNCNVSPLQLLAPGFYELVESLLQQYGIPPRTLVVEVTEAVLVEEDGPAVASLRRLAEAGVVIAIDDFGTGYSALGYLRRLPAQILKIDRSLTAAIADEPQARAIASAVIDLGRRLGVTIVVEGIETSDVARLATDLGAAFGQGTLYGSAMTMDEVVRLTRRPTAWTRPA